MAQASLPSLPLARPTGRLRTVATRSQTHLLAWYLPLALALLWWLASENLWMSEQILPAPSLVWHSALELAHGELWMHLGISLQRLLVGLLVGVASGALLGAWLGFS
ncbi:MAG: ABC transporter permease, partial [Pseudomonas sp.]